MAREYGGDVFDLSNMTDDEIRELILEQFREYPELDPDWIDVAVKDGFVTLSGRVGTDGEIQIAEKIVHDVIGISDYSNELVADELHRGEAPEGADEAIVEDEEVDEQLGEANPQQSDTASHLAEDVDSQTYGTHDMGQAIREGASYIPPDRPIPDGYDSHEKH
jgi:hypothetical protein